MKVMISIDPEVALTAMDVIHEMNSNGEKLELVGAGFGSLLVAMIATHGNLAKARRIFLTNRKKILEFFRWDLGLESLLKTMIASLMKKVSIVPFSRLKETVETLLGDGNLKGVEVMAFDLTRNTELHLKLGEHDINILCGSLARPPLFEPVPFEEGLLCDLSYMVGIPEPGSFDLLIYGLKKPELNNKNAKALDFMEHGDRLRTFEISRRRLEKYPEVVKIT